MGYNYDPFSQGQEEKQESTAKKVVKKGANAAKGKVKRKLAKAAAKLIAQAIKKGAIVLVKALITLLGTLGLPAILVIVGIVLLVIIITLVSSSIFGSGDDLNADQQELYDHIVEQSNQTVDLNNPEQAPYKVPVELLSSVVQLEAMQENDHYEIVTNMADVLAPTFTYSNDFNEWTETQTRICKEGEECEDWSDIERVDKEVSKLTNIQYWQGEIDNIYTSYITDWRETVDVEIITEIETQTVMEEYTDTETSYRTVYEEVPYEVTEYVEKTVTRKENVVQPIPFPPWQLIFEKEVTETILVPKTVTKYRTVEREVEYEVEVTKEREVEVEVEVEKELKTYTKTRHQRYRKQENKREDYTYLDTALNSLGFGLNDKRLLEVNYNFQDLPMEYIAWLEGRTNIGMPGGATPFPGTVVPGSDIPTQYMPYYLEAEAEYGVHWYMLASIHRQETVFSTIDSMVSSAGAEGHMQFMVCTWVGWSYPGCAGTNGNTYIPVNIKNDPAIISKHGGYGTDGNGDGIASPWDVEDAIHSAARYLVASGYKDDVRRAVKAYNHADWYVNEVVERSERYHTEAVYEPADMPVVSPGFFTRPVTGAINSPFGMRLHPNDGIRKLHAGVDIPQSGRTNVPIVAAGDGTVVTSKNNVGGWGNYIVIQHQVDGQQMETLYAHLASSAVRVGKQVKKGDFIGIMGNTGNTTGPHLHFEFHIPTVAPGSVNAINPVLYVPF